MRISDWSSDVCSSDLKARSLRIAADRRKAVGEQGRQPRIIIGDVRREAEVARRAQVEADFDPVDIGTAAVDRIGVEVDRREQARLNVPPIDMIGGDIDAQRLVDQVEARPDLEVFRRVAFESQRQAGNRRRIDVDAADAEALRIKRSEEHTSELQSLMRNSY